MRFSIRLAGIPIQIHPVYDVVRQKTLQYRIPEEHQSIMIHIAEDDIIAEGQTALHPQQSAMLEMLAVYRKIAEALIAHNILLMHGAVIALHGKAYMFSAPSGTGKSTHIRKWIDNLPESFVVNGDKPFIIAGDHQPMACGTPWAGKQNWQTNTMVPLAAIVIMERGDENEIEQISFSQAFAGLFRQTYQPKDTEKLKTTLRLLKSLDHKVRFYKFNFNNMKDDAFQVSYHELVEKQMD